MLLEMLSFNEFEKAVCHCFCCLLAQSHPVACIAFSQLLLRFTCVLCSSAYGFCLIVCRFVIAIIVFGVICSGTSGCGMLCICASSLIVCLLVIAIIVLGVLCSSITYLSCGVLSHVLQTSGFWRAL